MSFKATVNRMISVKVVISSLLETIISPTKAVMQKNFD